MINKSKVKLFQKYYRLNPKEFLEILDKWKTKSERQNKIIIELIKCIEKIEQDVSKFQIKQQTIFGEVITSLDITYKTQELLAKAKKEVAKIGVFE